jgi:hypothetical protein
LSRPWPKIDGFVAVSWAISAGIAVVQRSLVYNQHKVQLGLFHRVL